MTEIISVRFNNRGKAYFFDPSGLTVAKGDFVVVETAKGLEYGECTHGNRVVGEDSIIRPLRPVVRIATENDRLSAKAGKEKEREAFSYCQKKIIEYGLEMKLVDVEYGFEGNKILFFFTSEGRVDFRELVKDLAGEFRARIELRQIGVRDEAKILGGLGVCGKAFCCSQFLSEFHPVSIKMAKTQGISLNPTKISGTCGRLMCCLKYEDLAYEELVKKAPKVDAFVETPSGKGTVINVNLLRGNAKVRLEDGVDTTLKTFTFDELDVLGGKGRRAEYIAARSEGRLQEAGFTVTPTKEARPVSSPPPRNTRENPPANAPSASSATKRAGGRNDRKPMAEQRNRQTPPNPARSPSTDRNPAADHPQAYDRSQATADRLAKDSEKAAKADTPQSTGGAQNKKPYFRRNRGGHGKNDK